MAPRVLISDALSAAAVQIFKDRGIEVDFQPNLGKDKEKLAEIIGNYDGLAIRSATKVTPKILEKAQRLRVIGRAGIGVDNVDIKGIIVMNTPFGNSITTAEHALTLMLALARQIPQADASTQAGKWEKNRFMGVEITGKTLGVIGCGNIGSIVANRAIGLKMKVVAYDPFLSPERALELGVEKVELDELLRRADFITLHTPLTEKTRNIIGAQALAHTRKGVRIVNCARGGLVDEAALRAALDSGQVAGAAFDVFVEEPATENPLFGHPNVVCTPHLGAATTEAQENVALQVAEQMADYLLRGAISNAVNFPSITAEEAPRLKPFIALAERLLRGPAHRNRPQEGAALLRGCGRADEHQGADLGRDRRPAAPDAAGRERGLGADRRKGTRHRGRGDHPRGGGRLRQPDQRHGGDREADARRIGHRLRRRAAAHRQHQGYPHGRGVRALDDLHHQSRQARLHRPLLVHARRGRHQHRDIPCRPRGARRQRRRADRDRRRVALRGAGKGARPAASPAGEDVEVLT
jgi:phosphoglycerate dehydrogenase-like enzyme